MPGDSVNATTCCPLYWLGLGLTTERLNARVRAVALIKIKLTFRFGPLCTLNSLANSVFQDHKNISTFDGGRNTDGLSPFCENEEACWH